MPELPDVTIYTEALRVRIVGELLESFRLIRPFALRSVQPAISEVELRFVESVERLGKRIVIGLQQERFIVIHLMIAGRLLWREAPGARPLAKIGVAAWDFPNGTLLLTEASTKKRASIHLIEGREHLVALHAGGEEVFDLTLRRFIDLVKNQNQTIKRALTDPKRFSGIGNAYSDEILFAARISPHRLTTSLNDFELENLFLKCREVLLEATERLRSQFGDRFPGSREITAFRPEFAVHGKFGQPCPNCGRPVQRIVRSENELNYCAQCQNGGRILADRALSRLLKDDFPRGFNPQEPE
ncbi:MAG TPA: DNA-formamidopyrimidine glycosylase family protein [Fimbriimonadaceae bacterium]|nr:DNA-formamidopyrimidine glycosylase family protein [Fimbriimonadaceae bacterium]